MSSKPAAEPDAADPFVASLNGKLIPYRDAAIPVWDLGFTLGVSLTERLRTYAGQLKLIDRHLDRLWQGAAAIGIQDQLDRFEVRRQLRAIASLNWKHVDDRSDLAVGLVVTPGAMASALPVSSPRSSLPGQPTVLIYAAELPFEELVNGFTWGSSLAIVETREIPSSCIPKTIKHRNRLHYHLAELEAHRMYPGARALLLDQDGHVVEATTGSVVLIVGERIIAPPADSVLPSVSFDFSQGHFEAAGLKLERRTIEPDEVKTADEVIWFSTSTLLQPVTQVDGKRIGHGKPGPKFAKLFSVVCERLEFDLFRQAREMAKLRRSR